MKRKLMIGSLVSSVFVVLAVRGVDWGLLWEAVRQTHLAYLIPTVFLTLLGLYFRAYRWRFILSPIKSIGTNSLFSATSIGYMANNLLPARLGEIVRAYVLGRSEHISRTASFATIVYERVLDVFSLLAFLWIGLLRISGPDWIRVSGLWLLTLNIVLMVLIILLERHRDRALRIVSAMARPLSESLQTKIRQLTQAFLGGLVSVGKANTIVPIAVTSFLTWFSAALACYYCFAAMDLHLPLLAGVMMIVLVSMGNMVPSAPAYVGTTQYACVLTLALFGVGKTEALAYSLVYHATQFFPVTLLGLAYFWKAHMHFGELSANIEQTSHTSA